MPTTSSTDMAIMAAKELAHALKHPEPATPFHNFGDETLAALEKLSNIFNEHLDEPQRVEQVQQTEQTPPRVKYTVATRQYKPVTPPRVPNITPTIIPNDEEERHCDTTPNIFPEEEIITLAQPDNITQDTSILESLGYGERTP